MEGISKLDSRTYPSFLGFQKRDKLLAEPLSRNSDPKMDLENRLKEGYRVKIKKGVKRITVFRFLLAKLVYDDVDGLHLDEFIVMNELFYDLLDAKDPNFKLKYDSWFTKISVFMQDISGCQCFPAKLEKQVCTEELYTKFLEPYLPTKSAYFGLKGNRELRSSWTLILNSSLSPQGKFHKSVIGVGYRDKGYRKESHDGNPDWRECASHFSELFRRLSVGELVEDDVPSWLLSEFERESGE
jgi:hypothetical protein